MAVQFCQEAPFYQIKATQQSGFFWEEDSIRDSAKDYVWIIDPIDGTTNFSRDIPDYVISVALTYKKEAVVGVVFCPSRKQMFHASIGNGAYPCYV